MGPSTGGHINFPCEDPWYDLYGVSFIPSTVLWDVSWDDPWDY